MSDIRSLIYGVCIYFLIINIIAMLVTVADKAKAKRGSWRVPEARLFALALLGGAVGEYLTMIGIRHKTKHIQFMVGLPLIIFIQIVLIILAVLKVAV